MEIVYHVYNSHDKYSHHTDKKLVDRVHAVAEALLQRCSHSVWTSEGMLLIGIRYDSRDPISHQSSSVDELVLHSSISNVINQSE